MRAAEPWSPQPWPGPQVLPIQLSPPQAPLTQTMALLPAPGHGRCCWCTPVPASLTTATQTIATVRCAAACSQRVRPFEGRAGTAVGLGGTGLGFVRSLVLAASSLAQCCHTCRGA